MAKEEQIRTVLENYNNEALKDALAVLLSGSQSSVSTSNNSSYKHSSSTDTKFSNFAQAISWLKSKYEFQELNAFSTEADLVYVNTGDRKILLTDTSVKPRENQINHPKQDNDEFENAWENITSTTHEVHSEIINNPENIVKNEEKIESKDDFENAFEPKQTNSRFSNLEL